MAAGCSLEGSSGGRRARWPKAATSASARAELVARLHDLAPATHGGFCKEGRSLAAQDA